MSMDKLRDEIVGAIDRYAAERNILDAKIAALTEVLGTMDEMADDEPAAPVVGNVPARPHEFGVRAPRRDIQGTVKQAVRDYMEAKGLGPRLEDVIIGAGILLGSDITESAARRALDGLVAKGEMRLHDGRYATGAILSHVTADAAK